jgi:hypothetical protein
MHDLTVLAHLNGRKFHVRPVEYDYTTYDCRDGGGVENYATKYEVWELLANQAKYVDEFRWLTDAESYTEKHLHF